MKKLNRKGFTLIELLAVIVILGILMLTAIPAVTRAIARSRRNTYWQNAKSYVQAATTPFLSGEYVKSGTTEACPLPGKKEYVAIPLTSVELEQGDIAKSSFNAAYADSGNCIPYIIIANIESNADKADNLQWYFVGMDKSNNGITNYTNINDLKLSVVKTNGTCGLSAAAGTGSLTLGGTSGITKKAECVNGNQ